MKDSSLRGSQIFSQKVAKRPPCAAKQAFRLDIAAWVAVPFVQSRTVTAWRWARFGSLRKWNGTSALCPTASQVFVGSFWFHFGLLVAVTLRLSGLQDSAATGRSTRSVPAAESSRSKASQKAGANHEKLCPAIQAVTSCLGGVAAAQLREPLEACCIMCSGEMSVSISEVALAGKLFEKCGLAHGHTY